jgi:hypothetical protein
MKRPIALYWLGFFLLFLAFGGLYGGLAMLLDPSGGSLDMAGILPLLPVSSFVLPGLFLLVGMGLTPIVLVYALLARPKWDGLARLLGGNGRYWAWNATLLLSLTLAVWLTVQGWLIGFQWPIQYITAVNALLILLLALTPGVRRHYAHTIRKQQET